MCKCKFFLMAVYMIFKCSKRFRFAPSLNEFVVKRSKSKTFYPLLALSLMIRNHIWNFPCSLCFRISDLKCNFVFRFECNRKSQDQSRKPKSNYLQFNWWQWRHRGRSWWSPRHHYLLGWGQNAPEIPESNVW